MINKGDIVQCIGQVEAGERHHATGKIIRRYTQEAPEELFRVREFFGNWATLKAVEEPTFVFCWPLDQLTKKES